MASILALLLLLIWILASYAFATRVIGKLENSLLKKPMMVLSFFFICLLPIADELPLLIEFPYFCSREAKLEMNELEVKGTNVKVSGGSDLVPAARSNIMRTELIFSDAVTGEVRGRYVSLSGRGGTLARFLTSAGTAARPILPGRFHCAPDGMGRRGIAARFQFHLIN